MVNKTDRCAEMLPDPGLVKEEPRQWEEGDQETVSCGCRESLNFYENREWPMVTNATENTGKKRLEKYPLGLTAIDP